MTLDLPAISGPDIYIYIYIYIIYTDLYCKYFSFYRCKCHHTHIPVKLILIAIISNEYIQKIPLFCTKNGFTTKFAKYKICCSDFKL